MKEKKDKAILSFCYPKKFKLKLEKVAKKQNRTVSWLIRNIIDKKLKQLEEENG